MTDASDVFYSRINQTHIQWEQTEKLIELYKNGCAILLSSPEELKNLQAEFKKDHLDYSNDMVVDMIIKYVMQDDGIDYRDILRNLKIASIDENCPPGRAYRPYQDESYYIEISQDMERRIRLLADLLAVLFMSGEPLADEENQVLLKLLHVSLDRYLRSEEFTPEYNDVQLRMAKCDVQYQDNFTDRYVAYAREIHEMGMAFLIGHEIGHNFYGHTTRKPESKAECCAAEFKADGFAIDFAFTYLESAYPNKNRMYGLHFFAGIYLPLLASQQLETNIFHATDSHPSLYSRLLSIQYGMKKMLAETAWKETENYIRLLTQLIDFPLLKRQK